MSELSQRIITSHKEAAKRAVFFLNKKRKLKMTVSESLELLSCILGVSNWQTLLAMAGQEKGPRIDDGKAVVQGGATVVAVDYVEMLKNYYGTATSWGEHPSHLRSDWQLEVENGDTGAPYWAYVLSEIESRGEMLPWERDESLEVRLAKAAGWIVEDAGVGADYFSASGWRRLRQGKTEPEIRGCDTELEAWQLAAGEVSSRVCQVFWLRSTQWRAMTFDEQLSKAEQAYDLDSELGDAPSDELDNDYTLLPGEMTKDSRKFSQTVAFCRFAGVTAEYSEGQGQWATSDGFSYVTEEDAWEKSATRIQENILIGTKITETQWKGFDLETKLEWVKRVRNWERHVTVLSSDIRVVTGKMSEAERAKSPHAALLKAAKTVIEFDSDGWVTSETKVFRGTAVLPQDTEALAYQVAATATVDYVKSLNGITDEDWLGMSGRERVRFMDVLLWTHRVIVRDPFDDDLKMKLDSRYPGWRSLHRYAQRKLVVALSKSK